MKFKTASIIMVVVAFAMGVVLGVLPKGGVGIGSVMRAIGIQTQPTTTEALIDSIPENYHGTLQLFILAGQSNMSGLGDLPPGEGETNPRVYVFGNDYRWALAKEPMDDPTQQVDRVSQDEAAGFGPSLSFATTVVAQRPDIGVGLIPCAKGGSSIHDWRRSLSDTTLYGSCLKRARAASVMGHIAGLLFFQGEIDTVDPQEDPERVFSPHQWAERFTTMVGHWRSDLGEPDLPVVFAQIGSNTEPARFKHWALVQEQQRQVSLPFVAMITTHDLSLKDYVHFTTESYQVIGQRFAAAYLNLRP